MKVEKVLIQSLAVCFLLVSAGLVRAQDAAPTVAVPAAADVKADRAVVKADTKEIRQKKELRKKDRTKLRKDRQAHRESRKAMKPAAPVAVADTATK